MLMLMLVVGTSPTFWKSNMAKFVHIVQVHPVYEGIVQTHKVKFEKEFETKREAEDAVRVWNDSLMNTKAVYLGCVNDENGELV